MTQLINKSDFTGSYAIALTANSQNEALLNQLIVEKQDSWFKLVLGDVEFYKFKSDLSGTLPQSAKWLNFWNGSTITVDGKTFEFTGFKYSLVKLLFFDYAKTFNEKFTATGNKQQDNLESIHIFPSRKLANAYNTASDEIGIDWTYKFTVLNTRYPDYRTYIPNEFITDVEKYKGTIYNYLYYNSTLFPDWKFTGLNKVNEFSL